MIKSPNSMPRLKLLLLSRTGTALGILLLIGLAGGAWWLWIFVYEQLAPLVEKNLTQTLNRPVQMGQVERFSLTSLRFGASSVPATPTDPDRLAIRAVEVTFDPWQLVFNRTLDLNITLVNPDVYIEQDKKGDWISNTLAAQDSSGPIKTNLDTIRFHNANVLLVPHSSPRRSKTRYRFANTPHPLTVAINQVNGVGQFLEDNQIRFQVGGQPATGGTLALLGKTHLKTLQTNLQLQAQNLVAPVVTRLVELPLELQAGRVDGNLKIQFRTQQLSIFGTAGLKAVTAQIGQLPQPFINTQGRLRFQGMQATLENVQTSYGKIPLIANGVIDTEAGYNISGRVKAVSVANAQQTLGIELPVSVIGEATAKANLTGPILKPILSGTVATKKLARIDRVNFSHISTHFVFSAAEVNFKDIQATPTVGGKITGGGRIQLGQPELAFDLVAQNIPGDALSKTYGATPSIQVGSVDARAQVSGTPAKPKTVVNWKATPATYPATGEIIIASPNNLLFRNTVVNVAGGTVRAQGQLNNGQWQALGSVTGVEIGRILPLPPPLQGTVRAGRFNLSGGLATIGPETIQGNVSAQLRLASGTVATKVQLGLGRWQGSFAVDVDVKTLAQFPELISPELKGRLSGNINASGTLATLDPADIQAKGQLRLLSFAAGGLDFDPVLSGNLQIQPRQGVNLHLAGVQDRIELVLSPTYQPVSFLVRRDEALATGKKQADLLLVRARKLPLGILKTIALVPKAIASQPIAGELSGNWAINLNTFAAQGNIEITQPVFGRIKGNAFVGQLRYANGVGTLTSGEFTFSESRYALAGSITQTPNDLQLQGQVKIAPSQVQDILTALQFFNLQDFQRGLQPPTYARAREIDTVSVGLPEAPLLTQLRRFSEIEVLLQQQRQQRQNNSPLPSLADLEGTFGGEISLHGSLQKGVEVNFELEGKNWEWGPYEANRVIAEGSFKNGVLTLLPLRLESDETLVAFTGQVGGLQQSGQLRVRNLPVDVVNNFAVPVDITGQLNATATLAGSLENPQAIGEFQFTDGTINQKPIDSAMASFSHANARFNFGSNVIVSGSDPIKITGSVPLQLPFTAFTPDSNQISLDVDVQNEGLALVNLFTNQATWQGGQGQVQLQVRGTLEQPVATGIATVKNATVSAQALPEPLTDVTGRVQFNGNRIQVENFQGNFSQGNVRAQGVIPINARLGADDSDLTSPLSVNLERLELNLQELYRGKASGNVLITGSALSPVIGGEVHLDQGEVFVGETAPSASPAPPPPSASGDTVEFNNLRLTLGDQIRVTRPPILGFQAVGTLVLNGSLNDIRPHGTIRLRSGGVNLFTTQFNLVRSNENTATFYPKQGLDPNLDIEFVAAVPEVIRRRVPDSPLSAEIDQPLSTQLGALETVRVQARITGLASQIFDSLQLRSDPPRSETEIIALLGGGFVNTLGRGDSTLGFANFAGSAVLSNFQGTFNDIGNAFGLSELRLYPTVLTEEASRNSSTLGLAVEAGVDISRNAFVSLIRVLTADQPTRFSFSYRINDSFRIRTSTDFSGFTGAAVEYENRF